MAERRPRALLVSWLFPPHGLIGAKRAYKFARHLPSCGWDVTVLCAREPLAHYRDPSPWSVPDGVRVVAEYDHPWMHALSSGFYEWMHRRTSARPKAATDDGASTLRRSAAARAWGEVERLVWNTFPTEVVAMHAPHALRVARRLVRQWSPDVVWTTSYPYSAHLVGTALRRESGVPFVADLRDPWTLNFTYDAKARPTRWVERRLERLVFGTADRVTVTTETLAAAYRDLHPQWARKFAAIRNSFDEVDLPPRAVPRRPVRLVHFGHVYGGARTLGPVYEALARLRSAGAWVAGDLVLENLGRLSDDDRARAEELSLAGVVRAGDQLPYLEGLARLRASHLLLLPAWGTSRGHLFLPGKLYDYLLAGAPILAIGENPELVSILERTRAGTLVAPGDVDGIARAIRGAIDGTLPFAPDPEAVAEFSAPRATARLAALFEEVRREVRR